MNELMRTLISVISQIYLLLLFFIYRQIHLPWCVYGEAFCSEFQKDGFLKLINIGCFDAKYLLRKGHTCES